MGLTPATEVVSELARRLDTLGWVSELFVAGSLATGDHCPGVSDLDLVALTDGAVDSRRRSDLAALHRDLDAGIGAGAQLGCVYVDAAHLPQLDARHPTWTHGRLVDRILSQVTRAELVRYGHAVFGRDPRDVLPSVTDDAVRTAARAELTGYWAWAARRPHVFLDPVMLDLTLTSMARGRHSMATGQLLTKSAAIGQLHAPRWLAEQVSARRRGEQVDSPRVRAAWVAWQDARRTVALARR